MWIIDPNTEDDREWLSLLDGELKVAVEFDNSEEGYQDNIKIVFSENSSPAFALFKADETSLGLTSEEARKLALWLISAADKNDQWMQQSKETVFLCRLVEPQWSFSSRNQETFSATLPPFFSFFRAA